MPDPVKLAYQRAKSNAGSRGIEWLFTEVTWVDWWVENLGPNWMIRRGSRASQYCMARTMDQGPYAPWNVSCITNNRNAKDRGFDRNRSAARGSDLSTTKLTADQVIEIFIAPERLTALAKQYGVGVTAIRSIKLGRAWRHVTQCLGSAGTTNHRSYKLTNEQICLIYKDHRPAYDIAQQYKVSTNIIYGIKDCKFYSDLTSALGPPHKNRRGPRRGFKKISS